MHPKPQQRRPLSGTPLLFSAHFLCASIFCANSPCRVQYHSSVPCAKYGRRAAAALPFGGGLVAHADRVGELPLCQVFLLPQGADERAPVRV